VRLRSGISHQSVGKIEAAHRALVRLSTSARIQIFQCLASRKAIYRQSNVKRGLKRSPAIGVILCLLALTRARTSVLVLRRERRAEAQYGENTVNQEACLNPRLPDLDCLPGGPGVGASLGRKETQRRGIRRN